MLKALEPKDIGLVVQNNLLPTLKLALNDNAVSVIVCPVDYSENIKLTDKLGHLTESI